MIEKLVHKYALSKQGAVDMIKAIISATISNIILMVPVALLYYLVRDYMAGNLGDKVIFYVVGCLITFVLIGISKYIQYNATFLSTYVESGVRRVTLAEKLFPAANISEQISLASKEASGTGNMKFMLNGAITLGTSDGANVEIAELVGDENIYVFGEDSQTVIDRYERGDYCSKDYYDKDADLKKAVDFLVSDEMMKVGSKENLERLYNELLNKDWFMTFPDFEDYCKTKEKAYADYEDKKAWAKKMLVNISKAGFFSSDRTIKQYNDEIWHLEA